MISHSGGELPSGLQRMRVVYHSGTDRQLALTKEGIIRSWKLITVARFTTLQLCVWRGGHVYLCCGHVSNVDCEQLTVSQSLWTLALFSDQWPYFRPSHDPHFDYWTGDTKVIGHYYLSLNRFPQWLPTRGCSR